ncbi:MAG: neutral/alkaline non-lysosomal ceramidase N-terminal domain-containing protein [Chlamydiia bacterium]
MMKYIAHCLLLLLALPTIIFANVNVGIGKADITPHTRTPSAGYTDRTGEGMEGVHDSLLAIALFIDNGDKKIVFCSVDHLGFTSEMVQEIVKRVHADSVLSGCEIYIGSSHTHSGGGAYLNIPFIGASLAGAFDSKITDFYIQRTVEAILEASKNTIQGEVGIGYGYIEGLNSYRGTWPKDVIPESDVTVIKVTRMDGSPFAILFNYPIHPTVLKSQNRFFSSDFVGYARDHIQSLLGHDVQPIYFNGAQGDIIPNPSNANDGFNSCESLGKSLAERVQKIWNKTETGQSLHIATKKEPYSLQPQATPFGLVLPVENYKTEMNIIVLNHSHAFITIPGELSCLYDKNLKTFAKSLGFQHLSIFGLTNDAHGYIILPDSWRHKTMESGLSFGGADYGDITEKRAETLLNTFSPQQSSK